MVAEAEVEFGFEQLMDVSITTTGHVEGALFDAL